LRPVSNVGLVVDLLGDRLKVVKPEKYNKIKQNRKMQQKKAENLHDEREEEEKRGKGK
jgi:hypothetical protein